MLMPTYNLTATERVLPRMALDFTTGVLDSRVTVTRALNTATRVNSSGYVEVVNANLPRFDYVPSTLAARGLLIEESRANLFLQSEALTSPWTIDGGGSLNATPTAAPDNANTAKKLQENTANTYFRAYQGVTMTNGAVYTASVFAKPSGRNWLFLYFSGGTSTAYVNIATKTVGTTAGSPTITFSDYANGFTRVTMTFTNTSVGTQNVQAWLAQADNVRTYTGDGSSGMYLWGFQLELGSFPTSYIPTTATALTRNADVATITGVNFSGFWQTGKGAALVRAFPNTVSGTRPLIQFDDTTANNIIALRGNTTNPELYVRTGGADQAQIDAGTIAANISYRLAGAWATDSCAASVNSGVGVLDGVATIPTVTQVRLGSDGTNYLNGYLQSIEYYNERILNSTLQVVSSSAGYQSIISPVILDVIIS